MYICRSFILNNFFESHLNNHHLKVNNSPLHFHLDAFDVFVQHLSFSLNVFSLQTICLTSQNIIKFKQNLNDYWFSLRLLCSKSLIRVHEGVYLAT